VERTKALAKRIFSSIPMNQPLVISSLPRIVLLLRSGLQEQIISISYCMTFVSQLAKRINSIPKADKVLFLIPSAWQISNRRLEWEEPQANQQPPR
jgi:hypothetical protein